MSWKAEIQDALYLNFGVEQEEVDRLVPSPVQLDTRMYRGQEWGFFSLILYRYESIQHSWLSWPSFSYPQANLRLYVKNAFDEPALYFKRMFVPGLYSTLSRWYTGQPISKMSLQFPNRVHPGGEYRWKLRGRGEGDVQGKVLNQKSFTGDLKNIFDTDREFVDFFRQRGEGFYGVRNDQVSRVQVSADYGSYYTFRPGEWELGFLAEDLERHSFPEAIHANFLCPELSFEFDSPESVPIEGSLQ
ncbi:MAG: DUF2071 domain-containing protein [bacterium]